MLAHVASEEGIAAVERMAGMDSAVHYHAVPACIFTFPEIATVGVCEDQARQQGISYRTGKFQFAANGKAMTMGETDGLVKVIADQDDTIIGVHIMGAHAADLILEATLMVKNRLKIDEVKGTIHPHPTLGECLQEAIADKKAKPSISAKSSLGEAKLVAQYTIRAARGTGLGACTGVYKSTPLRDSTWATPTAQLECPGAPRRFASVLNARSRHPCRSSPSHFSLSPGVAPCSIKSLRRFIHPCLKFLLIA